jgi:hypothetical protein
MILVRVIKFDLEEGKPNDENRCPVTLGLKRATGKSCRAYQTSDGRTCLSVERRAIAAPAEVAEYIDDVDSHCGNNSVFPKIPPRSLLDMEPLVFEVPDLDSPAWQPMCKDCRAPADQEELDGNDGWCDACRPFHSKPSGGSHDQRTDD